MAPLLVATPSDPPVYAEVPIARDATCECCNGFDIAYPESVAAYGVVSREQYYAAIVRLNAAYAPDACGHLLCCGSLLCLLVPVVGWCMIGDCSRARHGRRARQLSREVERVNAEWARERCTGLPVRFVLARRVRWNSCCGGAGAEYDLLLAVGKAPPAARRAASPGGSDSGVTPADDTRWNDGGNDSNAQMFASGGGMGAPSTLDSGCSAPSTDSGSTWCAPSAPDTTAFSPPAETHHHHTEQHHHCHE